MAEFCSLPLCEMNMLSVWSFGSVSAVLFTTTRLCEELRPRPATQNGHQSLNGTCVALCSILKASVGVSRVRSVIALIASPETSTVQLYTHRRLLMEGERNSCSQAGRESKEKSAIVHACLFDFFKNSAESG